MLRLTIKTQSNDRDEISCRAPWIQWRPHDMSIRHGMQEKPYKNVDNKASLKDRGSRPMSATEWCSTGKYSWIYSIHSSGKNNVLKTYLFNKPLRTTQRCPRLPVSAYVQPIIRPTYCLEREKKPQSFINLKRYLIPWTHLKKKLVKTT